MKRNDAFLRMVAVLVVTLMIICSSAFAALAKDGKSTKKKPVTKKTEKKVEAKQVEPKPESQEQPRQDPPKTLEAEKRQKESEKKESEQAAKIEHIDREIARAEAQKKKGLIKIGAGLGLDLLAFLFVPSSKLEPTSSSILGYSYTDYEVKETGNAFLCYACLIAGSGFEIWGAYQWWDVAQTSSQLKTKRYDISLRPMIRPGSNGNVKYALDLQVNF